MTTTLSALDRLGVRVHGAAAPLLGLALRRNPKRAQLLVSRVLGKHIPTDPRLVRGAGLLLGRLVADALADRPRRPLPTALLRRAVDGDRDAAAALPRDAIDDVTDFDGALVLGFAETATALGHCVAEGLGGAPYLHSTRRPVPGVATAGGFTEEHSHATEHLLLPHDPALLTDGRPLVLVDDELSTGRTVLNTITALHRVAPRKRYGVAALVDVRSDYRVAIPEGEWSTLGGYVLSTVGRLPRVGDRAPYPGGEFEVVAMDGRRVAAVRVHRARAGTGAA